MMSEKVLRIITITFNLIILITGIAVLALGVWASATESGFKALLSEVLLAGIYILIAAGALVIVTASLGIFAASSSKRRVWIWVYAALLLLTVVLKIVGVILTFVFYDDAADDLKNSYLTKYGTHDESTQTWDQLQSDGECCGFIRYSDWEQSHYYANNSRQYPDSCCVVADDGNINREFCIIGRQGYIHEVGCEWLIRQYYYGIGATAIVVIFLELLSVLFMACLFQYY